MRPVALLIPLLVVTAGCLPTSAPLPPTPPTPTETPSSADEMPFVQITPAAREELARVAGGYETPNGWWLRLTVTPTGCTGVTRKLDFDPEGPGPGDAEGTFDGVRCVWSAEQDFLIQGWVVTHVRSGTLVGFSITEPNKTAENQKRFQEWFAKQHPEVVLEPDQAR